MKKPRVLVLMHDYLVPPDDVSNVDLETVDWRTEHDVVSTLRKTKYDVRTLGVKDDLGVIHQGVAEWQPHIAFNMLENFQEIGTFDQHVVSYLELLRVPYTGCNPRGLMLSRDKALSKTLLAYHRITASPFLVFRVGQKVRRPKRLAFPLIVKSLTQDASIGISQASVVENDDKLVERVRFIHESIGTDAIVERYIEGRELYVGVLGNQRLQVFPIWEMRFSRMPDVARHIATDRAKWNRSYQKKHGIDTGPARDLSDSLVTQIQHLCKRVYRTLELSGYARIDLRLDPEGKVFVIEANANPHIAKDEDFAQSAKQAGLTYPLLLQRIINTGLRWRPERLG